MQQTLRSRYKCQILKTDTKLQINTILTPGYHTNHTKVCLISGRRCLRVDTFLCATGRNAHYNLNG